MSWRYRILMNSRQLDSLWQGRLKISGVMIAAAALLSSCTTTPNSVQPPSFARPTGQQLLLTVSEGAISGHKWRVEVVRQEDQNCMQPIIDGASMGLECGFEVDAAAGLLVNLAVVANKNVVFLYGAVDSKVQSLALETAKSDSQILALKTITSEPMRYYGVAVVPADFRDLVGRGESGEVIFSGQGKVMDVINGDPPSPQTSPSVAQ